jgi:FKBP-type peptidyl-prolyl cis-trans isomerase SlyD
MQISKDTVAAFHYRLTDASGKQLEDSRERGQPQWYLHGRGHIVPGLEAALEGQIAGAQLTLDVPAAQAYGPRKPDNQVRVPLKRLKDIKPLKVGTLLTLQMPEGNQVATVVKLGMTVADLDLNHPLAGQDLHFDVEVLEVRAASSEELAHGHAHPPGMAEH